MNSTGLLITLGCLTAGIAGLTVMLDSGLPARSPMALKSSESDFTQDLTITKEHDTLNGLKREIDSLKSQLAKLSQVKPGINQRDLSQLRSEIQQIHQDIEVINLSRFDQSNPAEERKNPDNPSDTEDESILATTDQEQEYQYDEKLERIIANFENEAVDQEWSAETTQLIQQVFDQEVLSPFEYSNVECQSSMCRVEVTHRNMEERHDFDLMFPMEIGGVLPEITYQNNENDDGSITVVMYLARSSSEL